MTSSRQEKALQRSRRLDELNNEIIALEQAFRYALDMVSAKKLENEIHKKYAEYKRLLKEQ